MARMDNVGNIIGARKNPEVEARKRREQDRELVTSQWAGKDLKREHFYFINFQDMCELTYSDNTTEREWLPREVALIEFSLLDGIMKEWHVFVDPGPIPTGYRYTCQQKSEDTHKIPIDSFELDTCDYKSIWQQMKTFVKSGKQSDVYPPVYCLGLDYEKTSCLLDWLWERSEAALEGKNPLGRIYAIEDLVVDLLAHSGKPNAQSISIHQIIAKLDGSHWDFLPNTSCKWHEDQETKYCSLAIVKRYAYTISDLLARIYGVELTAKHVPEKVEREVARVLSPEALSVTRSRVGGLSKGQRARGSTRPDSYTSYRQRSYISSEPNQSQKEEDEFEMRDINMTSQKLRQPTNPAMSAFFGKQISTFGDCEAPPGPAVGQFEDWPELSGDGVPSSISTVSQMPSTFMSLNTSSPWTMGFGRDTAASVSAPPGFTPLSSTNHPLTLSRGDAGRGLPFSLETGAMTLGRGSLPPFGRGSILQTQEANVLSVGRGVPSVGRGAIIPPVGRGVTVLPVGRGTFAPPLDRRPPFGRGVTDPATVP